MKVISLIINTIVTTICELTMTAKTNMKEVKAIVADRRNQRSSSDSKVAQHNNIRNVGRRVSQ